MTKNSDPVRSIAAELARMFGQDPSQASQELISGQEEAELTTYLPDRLMARSLITGSIEIAGEVIELRRGRSALALDHPVVLEHPHLFRIPALPESEPGPPTSPPRMVCWEDQLRGRAHWTLGRRHGDRRRRDS